MKIIFACRDSVSAKYIANKLNEKIGLHSIIIESGKIAKRKKILRLFKGKNLLEKFGALVNIFFFAILNMQIKKHLNKSLKSHEYPEVNKIFVDDVNEADAVSYIKYNDLDLLVVMGTGILKSETINETGVDIINIHGGIVPEYRNVHSEFWALLKNDQQRIGTSILILNEGIDTGLVLKKEAINYSKEDNLRIAKVNNIKLGAKLITEVLKNYDKYKKMAKTQDGNCNGFYPTPGYKEIVKLWYERKI